MNFLEFSLSSKISILLSTYNGSKYLKNQLDSLFAQTYKDFEVLARDDGSSDDTVEILSSYNVKVLNTGENLGAKMSFDALLEYAVNNSASEYFMFCDQDDVWNTDKIEKTLAKMQEMEKEHGDIPLLVHTDLEVVDEGLHTLGSSFMAYQNLPAQKSTLNYLLMQNNITGCTVMINKSLAIKSLPMPKECMMHDGWVGLVASRFGKIGYVDEATIKYVQHSKNSLGAKKFDIGFVLKHIFKKYSISKNTMQAEAFLKQFEDELDKQTKKMFQDFITLEQKTFWQKRVVLWKYRLLKYGFLRNAGLFLKI